MASKIAQLRLKAQIRDIVNLEKLGMRASLLMAKFVREKIAAQFPNIERASHQIVDAMSILISRASVASHLYGRHRSYLSAGVGFRGAGEDVYDKALEWASARAKIDEEGMAKIEEAYSREASRVAVRFDAAVNTTLNRSVQKIIETGAHTRQGRTLMQEAFNSAGVGKQNPHLVTTLVRTQTMMAYSAGRYEANQDPALDEIIWGYEYVAIEDARTRLEHSAEHGTKRPKDDGYWNQFWPPNGYNCRCTTVEIYNNETSRTRSTELTETAQVGGTTVQRRADRGFGFHPGKMFNSGLSPTTPPPPSPAPISPPSPTTAVKKAAEQAAKAAAKKAAEQAAKVAAEQAAKEAAEKAIAIAKEKAKTELAEELSQLAKKKITRSDYYNSQRWQRLMNLERKSKGLPELTKADKEFTEAWHSFRVKTTGLEKWSPPKPTAPTPSAKTEALKKQLEEAKAKTTKAAEKAQATKAEIEAMKKQLKGMPPEKATPMPDVLPRQKGTGTGQIYTIPHTPIGRTAPEPQWRVPATMTKKPAKLPKGYEVRIESEKVVWDYDKGSVYGGRVPEKWGKVTRDTDKARKVVEEAEKEMKAVLKRGEQPWHQEGMMTPENCGPLHRKICPDMPTKYKNMDEWINNAPNDMNYRRYEDFGVAQYRWRLMRPDATDEMKQLLDMEIRRDWFHASMTRQQRGALKKWSYGYDQNVRRLQMNKKILARKKSTKSVGDYTMETREVMKNLDSAYNASPKFSGELHRGMSRLSLRGDAVKKFTTVGNEIDSNAWASWSKEPRVARGFGHASDAPATGQVGLRLRTKVKNMGIQMDRTETSRYVNEAEVLMPRARWRVDKVTAVYGDRNQLMYYEVDVSPIGLVDELEKATSVASAA